MLHLGVDPGLSGALALLSDEGAVVWCRDMPTLRATRSRREVDGPTIVAWLEPFRRAESGVRMTIELPSVRPLQHASAGIKTGISWGRVVGIAEALSIPFEVVSPQRWQKAILGDVPKGCSKDMARAMAQRLWPQAELGKRKTQDRSDALCLAEYGRRMWGRVKR